MLQLLHLVFILYPLALILILSLICPPNDAVSFATRTEYGKNHDTDVLIVWTFICVSSPAFDNIILSCLLNPRLPLLPELVCCIPTLFIPLFLMSQISKIVHFVPLSQSEFYCSQPLDILFEDYITRAVCLSNFMNRALLVVEKTC